MTKRCKHPRKAKKIMAEFVNAISDLYNEDDEKIEIVLKEDEHFYAGAVEHPAEWDELEIFYNFNDLNDVTAKMFRAYWTAKVPMLKGFANVTLTLLHELGHLETNEAIRKEYPLAMRYFTEQLIDEICTDDVDRNFKYFSMTDETVATEWGITWLSNPQNRKFAKAFEKKFFKCFA